MRPRERRLRGGKDPRGNILFTTQEGMIKLPAPHAFFPFRLNTSIALTFNLTSISFSNLLIIFVIHIPACLLHIFQRPLLCLM